MSTTVNTNTNTVTISESENSVLVTNNNTGNSVNVTGTDSPIITVASPGPKGDTGTFSVGSDLNIATITASGDISSSGIITAAEFVGTLSTTASNAVSSSFATTSSFARIANTATTATTATNANNVYVDANNTSTSAFHLPMYQPSVGGSDYDDGYYQLKNPINEVFYYSRGTNPVTNASQQSDYLLIGGGQNTTGGIFFNSTVQTEPFIYSDFNRMYIKADDRFGANNATYPARLEISTYTGSFAATGVPNYISLESTEIRITGSLIGPITASGNISASGNITAANLTISGDITSVGDDINVTDDLNLTGNASRIIFTGANGGSTEGVLYRDSGGVDRYGLLFPGSNIVSLANRTSNGVVQIRANTSTAGSGGEVTVAEFQDNSIQLNTNITASGNISASGTIESNGLILTSPDGTRYQISVDNSGNLSTTSV